MTTQNTSRKPALRSQTPDMIPVVLLRAMLALAVTSLVIVAAAVVSGREPVAQPAASEVVREKWIILEGLSAQAVKVRTPEGALLMDLPHGGFITVIQSGMATERRKHGVDPLKPMRIVEYANGRLAAEDPETGWSVELYAFGQDNKAAFERLLDE